LKPDDNNEQPAPFIEVEAAPEQTPDTPMENNEQDERFINDRKLKQFEEENQIDIAALIKPLERISLIDLPTIDNSIKTINKKFEIFDTDSQGISGNWFDLSAAFAQPSDIEFGDLASEFDRQREELADQSASTKSLIGRSFTISSGLSVGYLLWLVRGGTLMGSVLSSLPAWRLVDPLPVLGSLGEDIDADDESLESMVNEEKASADDKQPPSKAA